jgi:tetratricopeptide (TPR) repeat protein
MLFLYSEALASGDDQQSLQLRTQALEKNPHLFPALQRIAEQQIDAEDYEAAEGTLQQMLAVNPHLPAAHALRSVIFHLQGNAAAEAESRAAALKFCLNSPEPDHLIGTRLSRKYRFAEGAAAQRRALEFDPACHKARTQLAQDLLRLGQISEGWQLAEQAGKADQYNSTLFNLLQLKDSLGRYTTLKTEHFEIRMERSEAALYGPRVCSLLEEAWQQFTTRYAFQPEVPVFVEIYQRADDFAVRTFGIPDVTGFLGVCFGRVVTANSPASRRDSPVSWESVLWHEFCHVISLQKTGNRIPRWLSEGISVYEERLRDPRWGQQMTPEFRDRIREGRAVPIGRLSSAFLNAGSGSDLNFAYFESSLAVEHIITVHGLPAMNAVMTDLHSGLQINDALGRHCGGLESLQASFDQFLRQQADLLAPTADFSKEPLQALQGADAAALAEFCQQNPQHVPALLLLAQQQLQAQDSAAEQTLRRVLELYPQDQGAGGARPLLAGLYRERSDVQSERQILTEHLQRTADDVQAALRLQELSVSAQAWPDVIRYGQQIFAADPFRAEVQERMVQAGQASGDVGVVAAALQCLLQLQPEDAARLNFRLAQVLKDSNPVESRRRVLLALEQSPRYREAHQLLLRLQPPTPAPADPAATPDPQN